MENSLIIKIVKSKDKENILLNLSIFNYKYLSTPESSVLSQNGLR
jgi:hypothetical protein